MMMIMIKIMIMMMIIIVVVESFQPLPIISPLRGNYGKQYQLPLHRASVGVGVGVGIDCTHLLRLPGESFSSSSLSYSDEDNANDDGGGGTIVTATTAATAITITTPTGTEDEEEKEPSPFFQVEFESNGSIPLSTNQPTGATTEAKTKVVTKTATATAQQQHTATAPPRTMEKNIYGYNKLVIDTVYEIICLLYPVTGTPRDYARFYVLETVARVPYFAYLSVLHLRETFGERYDTMSSKMRTHYAEADNELHHLLIMESLGGNAFWFDRTVAQTMAFFYYWYVIVVYVWDEPTAYHLSELIEDHAYNTYNKYTQDYADLLKTLPVPDIARKYYEVDNPYLFDLFCTVKSSSTQQQQQQHNHEGDDDDDGTNNTNTNTNKALNNNNDNTNEKTNTNTARLQLQARPQLQTLYDVFINIRDDENEHWKTLCNLVQYNDMNAVDALEVHSTTPTLSTTTSTTTTSTTSVLSTDFTTTATAATTITPPSSDTVDS